MVTCFDQQAPMERLRTLCVTCLVLDCIFVLIYGLTAVHLSDAHVMLVHSERCQQASGANWQMAVLFTYAASAVAALLGAVVHGRMSCSITWTKAEMIKVSHFAHGLVLWNLIASLVEAFESQQVPPECRLASQRLDVERQEYGRQYMNNFVWQSVYAMLWLTWIMASVATALLARKIAPQLDAQEFQAGLSAGRGGANPPAVGMRSGFEGTGAEMPQTVGMPVSLGTASGGAFPVDDSLVVQGGAIVAQGRPVTSGSPTASLSLEGGGDGSGAPRDPASKLG
eukprot:TRINITY_DN63968_c0_g1_i1.p1 TRINITY_DN63968_c0_g1~~TRINITY_DN63968_c0_g1_i1.p1  ORF type:complete len:283 (-),score=54.76 TRINITY_DN63968_c0_g1_i1:70-918(-)